MKSFYFIRHAQSEANKAGIICGGGVDTPLSQEGIKQAEQARENLANINLPIIPDVMVHSGLSRTRHTAEIINQSLNLPMVEESTIKEHYVGQWEGCDWSEVSPDYICLLYTSDAADD